MGQKTDIEKLIRVLQQLTDKSLTNTKPLVITDTDAVTDVDAFAIYGIEDSTFTTLDGIWDNDDLSAETLPKGHIWYVPIRGTVDLASGAVIVYQNKELGL